MPLTTGLTSPTRVAFPKDHLVDVTYNPPLWPTPWGPFIAKHAALRGAPGTALAPSAWPEQVGAGRRIRYQNGTIYQNAAGAMAWVYGAIGQRYDEIGGPSSWLGLPLADESDFAEGGRVSAFEHGAVYWWPEVGAVELHHVAVSYTGLLCFGETDHDGDDTPSADEPYVELGVVSPGGGSTVRSQIYTDVDSGDVRSDLVELYRGLPVGLAVGVQLLEHDFGDPDRFKEQVRAFVSEASTAVAKGLAYVPVLGPVLSWGAEQFLPMLESSVTDFVNDALDTDDDDLGSAVVTLSARQMVVLAARTPDETYYGVRSKVQTGLLGANQGASYKVCFSLAAV